MRRLAVSAVSEDRHPHGTKPPSGFGQSGAEIEPCRRSLPRPVLLWAVDNSSATFTRRLPARNAGDGGALCRRSKGEKSYVFRRHLPSPYGAVCLCHPHFEGGRGGTPQVGNGRGHAATCPRTPKRLNPRHGNDGGSSKGKSLCLSHWRIYTLRAEISIRIAIPKSKPQGCRKGRQENSRSHRVIQRPRGVGNTVPLPDRRGSGGLVEFPNDANHPSFSPLGFDLGRSGAVQGAGSIAVQVLWDATAG